MHCSLHRINVVAFPFLIVGLVALVQILLKILCQVSGFQIFDFQSRREEQQAGYFRELDCSEQAEQRAHGFATQPDNVTAFTQSQIGIAHNLIPFLPAGFIQVIRMSTVPGQQWRRDGIAFLVQALGQWLYFGGGGCEAVHEHKPSLVAWIVDACSIQMGLDNVTVIHVYSCLHFALCKNSDYTTKPNLWVGPEFCCSHAQSQPQYIDETCLLGPILQSVDQGPEVFGAGGHS